MPKPPFHWLSDQDWPRKNIRERALLWAAYFADVVRPREIPLDSNRGEWVETFLRSAGVGPGNPWCASFVTWCYRESGLTTPPKNPASVYGWVRNGVKEGKTQIVDNPIRGDLFFWLNRDNHGHIGFVVEVKKIGPVRYVETIEGNAQPGESGNQREGGGVYRRRRLVTPKIKFLRVW